MLRPERRVNCPSTRTISLVFARGRSNVIVMQYHPHFLRCSAADIMHVYIVDSLLGSLFTNASGRTADVLYARGSPVHFAHKPATAWMRKDHFRDRNKENCLLVRRTSDLVRLTCPPIFSLIQKIVHRVSQKQAQ